MSNPKDIPPDDFGATVPNFRLPQNQQKQPPPPPPNDFGQTIPNFRPASSQPQSPPPVKNPPPNFGGFGNNPTPPPQNQPPRDFNSTYTDFGATRADFSADIADNYGKPTDNFGATMPNMPSNNRQEDFSKTMPYFKLPEVDRSTIAPPVPVRTAENEGENKKKGYGWLWLLGTFCTILVLIVLGLGLRYLLLNETGFRVTVQGAQPQSEAFVDGASYGTTSDDGTTQLPNLKAGARNIVIKKEGFADFSQPITGENGQSYEMTAQQKKIAVAAPPKGECEGFKPQGAKDIEKAARCANIALDNLQPGFSVDDLLKALNMLVINFASGKFDIPTDKQEILRKAAGLMQKLPPTTVIEVGGHTDNVGQDNKNKPLSENRANAVKTALVGFGVKAEMLQTKGYGKDKPKASNETDEGKFQNRRIEYTAISK